MMWFRQPCPIAVNDGFWTVSMIENKVRATYVVVPENMHALVSRYRVIVVHMTMSMIEKYLRSGPRTVAPPST